MYLIDKVKDTLKKGGKKERKIIPWTNAAVEEYSGGGERNNENKMERVEKKEQARKEVALGRGIWKKNKKNVSGRKRRNNKIERRRKKNTRKVNK